MRSLRRALCQVTSPLTNPLNANRNDITYFESMTTRSNFRALHKEFKFADIDDRPTLAKSRGDHCMGRVKCYLCLYGIRIAIKRHQCQTVNIYIINLYYLIN